MFKLYLTLTSFFGFGMGDADEPYARTVAPHNQEIIRVLDSVELQGLNSLEAHDADTWFV